MTRVGRALKNTSVLTDIGNDQASVEMGRRINNIAPLNVGTKSLPTQRRTVGKWHSALDTANAPVVPSLRSAVVGVGRIQLKEITRVGVESRGNLLVIIQADNALRLRLGLAERGDQHGGQNGNDGDDDKQFNQGETQTERPAMPVSIAWKAF